MIYRLAEILQAIKISDNTKTFKNNPSYARNMMRGKMARDLNIGPSQGQASTEGPATAARSEPSTVTPKTHIIEVLAVNKQSAVLAVAEKETRRAIGLRHAIRVRENPPTYRIIGDATVEDLYSAEDVNVIITPRFCARVYKKHRLNGAYSEELVREVLNRTLPYDISEILSAVLRKKVVPCYWKAEILYENAFVEISIVPFSEDKPVISIETVSPKKLFLREPPEDVLRGFLELFKGDQRKSFEYLVEELGDKSRKYKEIVDIMFRGSGIPEINFLTRFYMPTAHVLEINIKKETREEKAGTRKLQVIFNFEELSIEDSNVIKEYETLGIDLAKAIVDRDPNAITGKVAEVLSRFSEDYRSVHGHELVFRLLPEELEDLRNAPV